MAISEHKNGHFEEIRGWLQILELGSNSTIFHLLFDTYDSPGAIFIWKWEIYRPLLLVCIVVCPVRDIKNRILEFSKPSILEFKRLQKAFEIKKQGLKYFLK